VRWRAWDRILAGRGWRPPNVILVTGASGLLGGNLVVAALNRGLDIAVTYHRYPIRFPGTRAFSMDATDPKQIESVIRSVRPDWIIHCAAATDVDWCEDHPREAQRINVDGPMRVAAAAGRASARFIFISTDAVFDGRTGGYREKDPAAPVNVYSSTKRAAESSVLADLPTSLIVRTNIYGWNLQPKQSLAEWILGGLEAGNEVPGFSDVVFTPILATHLSEILLDMMDRSLEGLYHVVGSEALTKYEFARRVANVFGHPPQSIRPIPIADARLRAPRPRNTSLRTDKAEEALGRPMPSIDAGLRRFKGDRDSGFVAKLKGYGGG
jgi:dTDP-4-dehydrorhamnose reductase